MRRRRKHLSGLWRRDGWDEDGTRMLRHRTPSALAELTTAAAMPTEATQQHMGFAWGQALLAERCRVWAPLETAAVLAYEEKVAAQVQVLEDTTASLGQLSRSLAHTCHRLRRHQQALRS